MAATAPFLIFGVGSGLGALALFDLPVFGAGAVFAACLATTLLFVCYDNLRIFGCSLSIFFGFCCNSWCWLFSLWLNFLWRHNKWISLFFLYHTLGFVLYKYTARKIIRIGMYNENLKWKSKKFWNFSITMVLLTSFMQLNWELNVKTKSKNSIYFFNNSLLIFCLLNVNMN